MTTLDEERGLLSTNPTDLTPVCCECVFLYQCVSFCVWPFLSLSLSFPLLRHVGLIRKRTKGSLRYELWKRPPLLRQRMQLHIISNWMSAVKAGENYILKPGFEKTQNGANLLDAAGWDPCWDPMFFERIKQMNWKGFISKRGDCTFQSTAWKLSIVNSDL